MFSNLILKFHLVWKSHGFKYIHIYKHFFFYMRKLRPRDCLQIDLLNSHGIVLCWWQGFSPLFIILKKWEEGRHEFEGPSEHLSQNDSTNTRESSGVLEVVYVWIWEVVTSVRRWKMSTILTPKICALVRKLYLNFEIRNHSMIWE